MTLALAAVANLAWFYFIFKYEGLKNIVIHIFGNKADKNEVGIYILIFIAVGVIEIVSILFRPVSLTFRLFGNVFIEGEFHSMFRPVSLSLHGYYRFHCIMEEKVFCPSTCFHASHCRLHRSDVNHGEELFHKFLER